MESWNDNRWESGGSREDECPVCGELLDLTPHIIVRGEFPEDDEHVFAAECPDPECGWSTDNLERDGNPAATEYEIDS